jgi:hypothetical protein
MRIDHGQLLTVKESEHHRPVGHQRSKFDRIAIIANLARNTPSGPQRTKTPRQKER